ncbi:MAG: FtsQ-type POTRA domain-containing protein [Acidobacteria bacterium]|nr:FtsQ-type POTRA domain-containing protein [Acidobacteriota bacterium]
MEIKTNRSRETINARVVPPPDKARLARKKAGRKLGNNHIAGRRFVTVLKTLGKVGAFLLLLVFMLSIFVYSFTSEKFNLRKVTVYGCKELDHRNIEKIIRRDFPENILRIDLPKLKKRLEKETWAKEIEIRRVLPSDLIIYVQERVPSVIFEMNNELMIADKDGILLGRYEPRFGKLDVPVLKGLMGEDAESYCLYQEENTGRIQQALFMLSEIESGLPQHTQRISEVDVSDRENLKVLLVDDTAELYLGEKDYLKRFRTFINNLSEYQKLKIQYDEFASIDMRYDGQIVYRPRRENAE